MKLIFQRLSFQIISNLGINLNGLQNKKIERLASESYIENMNEQITELASNFKVFKRSLKEMKKECTETIN